MSKSYLDPAHTFFLLNGWDDYDSTSTEVCRLWVSYYGYGNNFNWTHSLDEEWYNLEKVLFRIFATLMTRGKEIYG